ncbi:MAG: adenylate kinase [Spirochaetota bacterium]
MNILIFGPNGSGKGTQGAMIQKMYNIVHVESGVLFRDNIRGGTDLGKQAKAYIDKGELVPDEITIPMILDRINKDDCDNGWLLDGFPRNPEQAKALENALFENNMIIDFILEIILDRDVAKNRIMGRRLCVNDNNHPNNIFIDAIMPEKKGDVYVCRVCGGELTVREDDQDENAINKRHAIYFDEENGTRAAVEYFKELARKGRGKVYQVDGSLPVNEVRDHIKSLLHNHRFYNIQSKRGR